MTALIFLIIMLSSVLLSLMGALPFWVSEVIIVACLAGLGVIGAAEQQDRRRIRRRCRQLHAAWGMKVNHLGGLPLPLDTQGVLYLLEDHLRLDTEHDRYQFQLQDIRRVLLVSAETIRSITDRRLCELLKTGNIRSFSSLREKIRHHDKTVRHSGLIMLAYREEQDAEARLLVLATQIRLTSLAGHFTGVGLPQDLVSLISPDGSSQEAVV